MSTHTELSAEQFGQELAALVTRAPVETAIDFLRAICWHAFPRNHQTDLPYDFGDAFTPVMLSSDPDRLGEIFESLCQSENSDVRAGIPLLLSHAIARGNKSIDELYWSMLQQEQDMTVVQMAMEVLVNDLDADENPARLDSDAVTQLTGVTYNLARMVEDAQKAAGTPARV